jgi:cyclic-di-GMP-binding protein
MTQSAAFALPKIDPKARPEFADGPGCKAWLQNLPLANVASAQRQLLIQVEELNRHAAPARARLEALEAAREAVHFVQVEQAKRFTYRALPMLPGEAAIFEDTIELWEQMRLGYLRCLQEGGAALRPQAALLCQRALSYSGLRMYHRYRACRLVPGADWRALHQVYARAEALGVADKAVKDYLNRDVYDSSPRIAYLRALLMGACNPNELGPRQLAFVAYLLERWADKVEITETPPKDEDGLPPFAVDLEGEHGAERNDPQGAELRFLNVRRLAKSLRNRVALLRKGESPARLALGEDCVQPSCEQLLVFLYRQWCQARPPRNIERARTIDAVQACTSIAAIHYYALGRMFRAASEFKQLSAQQRDEIETFGRIVSRGDEGQDFDAAREFLLEHWQLEDESTQGLRMMRRAANPGRRMAQGQLVGVRPADAKTYQLGQVRWLTASDAGDLHCGVKLLPGVPVPVAVRALGVNVAEERFTQAFMLAAVPAFDAPATLVMAAGWFKPKRVIEVAGDKSMRVRLLEVLERGNDFERVTYERLAD